MPTHHRPALGIAELQLAFDHAPVGLCVSRQRVILQCNVAFERMFGYARGVLVGQSLVRLYPTRREFEQIGERGLVVMKEQATYSDQRIMRAGDGRLFWCQVSGQSLTPDDPFEFAVWAFEDLSAARPVTVTLTSREREIAPFLVAGRSSKQIASALHISPRTVEAHRSRLMKKMNVRTTGELIARLISGKR